MSASITWLNAVQAENGSTFYTQRVESGLALPLHLLDDDHIVP